MKCPHCEYVDGWSAEKQARVDGDEGCFYSLTNDIRAERKEMYDDESNLGVYACPSCKKVFID